MLYTRKQLEVVKFVNKDETRPSLNGIYLDPGGDTIATNGHILVKVHANGKAGQNEAFPKLKSGAPIESLPKEGAIVPADIIKDVIKNIPRNMGISICENAALTKADKDGVSFTTTDFDRERTESGHLIDGQFPEYEKVIPDYKTAKYTRIGVSAKYLADLALFAADPETGIVELHIPHDSTQPLVIKNVRHNKEDILGVIMLMQLT